ncbi:MAG: NAD-dependent epimerase/dehydratase family protein [Chitinophagaceae bacterium]|nr:NAD-dependent epimerase/dehydratase family protein [Chitinophagaceae bacterium]MCB9047501.1 NAD-dependent epimerase/dehydratase family protein [Chitinophagales bacterium]
MTSVPNIVLVTGASGFVGNHLVKLLSARGETVKALYNSRPPKEDMQNLPGVSWIKCDLLDVYDVEEVMQDVTEVYHCAAVVSFKKEDKQQLLHFNTESTANVVNEALERGVRKMVYVSSIAALGRSKEGAEITEEEQWEESKYNSVYAESKHLAEQEVWRGQGEGLEAVVVNPGIIIGEGDWDTGSTNLVKIVYKEFPYYTGGINAWVDVVDVVSAMYMLMKSEVEGERFILSAGNFSYKDVFTMMAHAMNKKPPHKLAGSFLSGIVWRVSVLKSMLTGSAATITRETARTAQRKALYSNAKLLKAFPGFAYTPFEETVKRIAKAFLSEENLKS